MTADNQELFHYQDSYLATLDPKYLELLYNKIRQLAAPMLLNRCKKFKLYFEPWVIEERTHIIASGLIIKLLEGKYYQPSKYTGVIMKCVLNNLHYRDFHDKSTFPLDSLPEESYEEEYL